jgi:hypothetical protein
MKRRVEDEKAKASSGEFPIHPISFLLTLATFPRICDNALRPSLGS